MKTLIQLAAGLLIGTTPIIASPGRIVTGADTNSGGPHIKAFTTRTLTNVASFFAYAPTFNGGVRVASGDVNGDGAADIITGSGPGAAHVKVFSGSSLGELRSFLPYGSGFSGGVFVAAGDVNGDGLEDIVTGTDAGAAPHVKVFNGNTGAELHSFFAYPANFSGGVRVAVGDINGDGRADIITGSGPGGGSHVKVFDGISLAEIRSFFAYAATFAGGVFVAAGDINGDGLADIITGAGPGAGPHVKVFDGTSLADLQSFFAYSVQFTGGVRVASGDMDGDGRAEILTAPGSGSAPQVRVFDGATLRETANFLAYPASFSNGVFLAASPLKRLRLESSFDRAKGELRLQWPSACLCELEGNPDLNDPRGWMKLEVQPVQSGNRLGLLLPAVQKFQSFRLNCDDEFVREIKQ